MRLFILLGVLAMAVQALMLALFGQPLIAAEGTVKLWEGVVLGPGNSQHLTDWYTFSHVIHGIVFYAALTYLFPQLSVGARFALAVGIEAGWEVIENTPWLINHYREQTLAVGYAGDSVINSICDTAAAILGFVAARRLPVVMLVLLVLGLELFVGYMIRDNLTLNILNFLHQFDFIIAWQSGS